MGSKNVEQSNLTLLSHRIMYQTNFTLNDFQNKSDGDCGLVISSVLDKINISLAWHLHTAMFTELFSQALPVTGGRMT